MALSAALISASLSSACSGQKAMPILGVTKSMVLPMISNGVLRLTSKRSPSALAGLRHKQGEFVPAKPVQPARGAQAMLQAGCDGAEQGVAGVVAVLVVDLLEVIEIDEEQSQGFAAMQRLLDIRL